MDVDGSAEIGSSGTSSEGEEVVRRLVTAQRMHALYPRKNPKVLSAVARLREALAAFPRQRPVEFGVGREHLLFEDLPILADQTEVRDLARKLYLASIAAVALSTEAEEEEVLHLLDLLRLSDDERRNIGSLSEELRRRGVQHIQVREIGRVSIETASGLQDPWDLTSLEELEALEMALIGDGMSESFHESFRAADGHDPKAGRLLGLLGRPAEFATLLLDTASQHRNNGKIDLDAQLAFIAELVSRLEPMLDKVPPADASRLYRQLTEAVTILERGVVRELLDVSIPPYVRLGALTRLFPERIRAMTVKEALGLGLGPGLMPFLIGALRRIAAGDEAALELLTRADETEPERPVEYRPAPPPPVPPKPLTLGARFFEPSAASAASPGQRALAEAIATADGTLDSIATLVDLLAQDGEQASYGALTELLAQRFQHALATRNFPIATGVLRGLYGEWTRRAETPGPGQEEMLAALGRAYERCGSPETMRSFLAALDPVADGEPLKRAVEPLLGLTAQAASSLVDLLGEEREPARRKRLLDVLALAGLQHAEAIAVRALEADAQLGADLIGLIGGWGAEMVPRLVALGAHPEGPVRKALVRALAPHGTKEALEALARLVQDSDDTVAREALKILVEAGERSCLATLHEEIQSARLSSRHPATVAALVRALAALGDERSRELLATVVKTRGGEPWLASSARLRKLFEEAAAGTLKPTAADGV